MSVDVFVVDNYDSFTHNAVDLLRQLGARVEVARNDRVRVADVLGSGARGVVLSPGPGRPEDAGVSVDLVRAAAGRVPVLGICLGHQAIAVAHGGRVVRAEEPLHGTASDVRHRGAGLLAGIPSPMRAARYHSLVVDSRCPGRGVEPTAWSARGEVMALRHGASGAEGVQFHPESFLTPHGPRILAAFLRRLGLPTRRTRPVVR
jgi:anthranilate synthase/aminodeoxychorismate synthase-like glutamine amidotransferase